jgi:hypothetical protein
MLMPPSTKPESNFISIYSYNTLGNIDSCSLSISQIQPNTFKAISLTQGVVQTLANVNFDLTLSTPLAASDLLIIAFDPSFDVSKVGATVTISGYGVLPLQSIGNTLQITSISKQPVLGARLIFTLSQILMPFVTSTKSVNISL